MSQISSAFVPWLDLGEICRKGAQKFMVAFGDMLRHCRFGYNGGVPMLVSG